MENFQFLGSKRKKKKGNQAFNPKNIKFYSKKKIFDVNFLRGSFKNDFDERVKS